MDILKRLFGKEEKNAPQEDIPTHVTKITDQIIDWFKADNLSIANFQKLFEEEYWKPLLIRTAEHSYRPPFHEHFVPSALYFLIVSSDSHPKNIERLAKINSILKNADLSEYGRDNFFISFGYSENSGKFIEILKKGATIVNDYRNLQEKNRLSVYTLIRDLDYYIPFIKALPANRLYIFAKLYIDRDNKEYRCMEDVPFLIKEEIDYLNQDEFTTLDYDIVMNFLEILGYSNTKEWDAVYESKKRKTDLSQIPVFKNFMDKAKDCEQEYLTVAFYFMQKDDMIPYRLNKALDQMVLEIIGNNRFDKEWVYNQFKTKVGSFYPFFGQIVNNIHEELRVGDKLVILYEEYCFEGRQGHWTLDKKLVAVLENIYRQVEDERVRDLYLQRIYGIKVIGSRNSSGYDFTRIDSDEKLEKTKELFAELNYILPITIKNILNKGYYSVDGDNVDRALIICEGQEMTLTDDRLDELNRILDSKQTGYQLVPIPISESSVNYYTYTLGTLAICNYEDYTFIQSMYGTSGAFRSMYSNTSYSKIDTIPFKLLKNAKPAGLAGLDTDIGFIFSTDWQWFKDSYIDNLSSKEKWYKVMDVAMQCSGTKTANKKWLAELSSLIDKFPSEKYYQELQALLTKSLKEDFWFFDTYEKGLKGLLWSCTIYPSELSLNVLRLVIEKAYAKVPGIGPKSTALGNFAINLLIGTQKEEAFGMLNIMRNKTKYNRFAVALDKAIDKFKETSDLPEQLLADKTIPRFDFVNNERIVPLGDYSLQLYFEKEKLQKKWITPEGKSQSSVPATLSGEYESQIKELNSEVKQINQVYKDLSKRIRTYWLYDRSWCAADWKEFILNHPLINPHIQNLVWMNMTQGDDFIIVDDKLRTADGKEYILNNSDTIVLWHPVLNRIENIKKWRDYVWKYKIVQSERQIFREYYPFSPAEKEMADSPRFANHFLEVNKLMAIANGQGWIFTYVHEGYNWPRIYIKQLDITFHLKSDYSRNEFAMPTQEIFATRGNTTKIEYTNKFDKMKFVEIPAVVLSELCRDIDLFIATTTVANNPELARRQIYQSYYQSYEKGLFSENATAKVRHDILEKVLPAMGVSSFSFEGNFLLVDGMCNSYKINLGSGFAQTQSGKHLNLLPSVDNIKKNKKVILPIEDDDILYLIIAKTIFLVNDNEIKDDEKFQGVLN